MTGRRPRADAQPTQPLEAGPVIDDRKPRPVRPRQGPLTGKQLRTLRGLGHHLKVVVQVG